MKLPFNEYVWAAAEVVEARKPHPPELMRSACSVGPIYSWLCDGCRIIEYTTRLQPPTCLGGWPRQPSSSTT